MKFTRLAIPECIYIEPDVRRDPRGSFYESYKKGEFQANGISEDFVQDNQSFSTRGVLRGLHFQIAPHPQAKLVRVLKGRAFDVAVDIRKDSKTFGKYSASVLSEENKQMLYIPAGFAHGFCVLEDNTEFLYKVSDFYSPRHERGIIWNDPAIGIDWPKLDGAFVLSEKDQKYPTLKKAFQH